MATGLTMAALEVRRAIRMVAAIRRGSSSPIVVDTDHGRWIVKLRGAAQGVGPLIAEIVVAELAGVLGLQVPARALITIDADFAGTVRGDELGQLVDASVGLNLGLAWLDGAHELTPEDAASVDPDVASRIVWLDGLVGNADRTVANPNILRWRGADWLVDHGAALTFQYAWGAVSEASPRRVARAGPPHALATRATRVDALDEQLAARLTREVLAAAVALVPDELLSALPGSAPRDPARLRAAYVAFLWKRLRPPRPFAPASPQHPL